MVQTASGAPSAPPGGTDPGPWPAGPPNRRTSILPAMVVLLVAVVVLAAFALVDAATSSSTTPTTLPLVTQGHLRPDVHDDVFHGETTPGVPPKDIASVLLAPVGTTRVARIQTGGNDSSDYDVETELAVRAPRSALLGFYETNLKNLGWTLFSSGGSGSSGAELLFEKAGSDGNYWEAGVVAQPTELGTTTYTLRLFQVQSDM